MAAGMPDEAVGGVAAEPVDESAEGVAAEGPLGAPPVVTTTP